MGFPSSSFPDPGFPSNLLPLFVGGMFLLVFGAFAFVIVSGIAQWMKDNAAPVETFEAHIIAKRDKTTISHSTDATTNMVSRSTHHNYFATFEYSNGQRREFSIRESEYGILLEGDNGTLTFQGSRYNGFQRHN